LGLVRISNLILCVLIWILFFSCSEDRENPKLSCTVPSAEYFISGEIDSECKSFIIGNGDWNMHTPAGGVVDCQGTITSDFQSGLAPKSWTLS